MKKILLSLFGIAALFGVSKVNAAEIKLEYDTNFNYVNSFFSEIGTDRIFSKVQELIDHYKSNYASDYPYYHISLGVGTNIPDNFIIGLQFYTSQPTADILVLPNEFSLSISSDNCYEIFSVYDSINNSFIDNFDTLVIYSSIIFSVDTEGNYYYSPYAFYYSNFNFYYDGTIFKEYDEESSLIRPDDNLFVPSLSDSDIYSVNKADSTFLIEPYYLYDENEYLKEQNFITIDLNKYSYVSLSLKDYSKTETFSTNMYVQGQLCLTPIYNYGMTEKTEYYPGYQVDRCSPYYDDFTTVRTYILKQDLKNNAIYYLKAYDTTKDNVVKVDSSVFDITYITEEEKDNPYVSIGGKTYPTISYDNLSSSATKSEEEDYISGVVCQVGDFNCYSEYNPENIFDEIFSSPLKFLEDIWESVTSVFTLITEFISLLPPTMQSFLYLSFMVAVILGLLKIIL